MILNHHKKYYKEQLIDPQGIVRAERDLYIGTQNSWIKNVAGKWDGRSSVVLERVYTYRCLPKAGDLCNEYTEWEEV